MKYVEKLDGTFFLHWESLWPGVSVMWMLSSELAGLRGPDNLSCGKHSPVCHNPFITITDTAAAATLIATIYFILTVR